MRNKFSTIACALALGSTGIAHATPASSCLMIGDTAADGSKNRTSQCIRVTQPAITSKGFFERLEKYEPLIWSGSSINADQVFISLGTNDPPRMKTRDYLLRLRAMIQSKNVVWILPSDRKNVSKTNEILFVVAAFGIFQASCRPSFS